MGVWDRLGREDFAFFQRELEYAVNTKEPWDYGVGHKVYSYFLEGCGV
jgi:hypothetical protein